MDSISPLVLLDSDVIIDIQRSVPEALSWINSARELQFALPASVAFEIVIGAKSNIHLQKGQRFLSRFEVKHLTAGDSELALELIQRHVLASGLSLADYLIAAQALNLNAILYSFNLRHFRTIPGLDVRQPYSRGEG